MKFGLSRNEVGVEQKGSWVRAEVALDMVDE